MEQNRRRALQEVARGFTLLELLITIMTFSLLACFVFGLTMGNYWYTENGVLEKIRLENPRAIRILDSERNLWGKSVFVVDENGKRVRYCLDSNIFYNYAVKPCSG